ncbi:hypothetical protein GGX14DRAFT_352791 [Mycena pura]|uniref:Uncharacterized protein n=1 Tax=Mycena pura TaxID=153505 RepID=A0AAD6YL36_9AGAR|nr:hypothetical protein GGX14DRAFT_352791 [Mycena pura]
MTKYIRLILSSTLPRAPIPRHMRLCRFCRAAVEDKSHVLLECAVHGPLVDLREAFLAQVFALDPNLEVVFPGLAHYDFLVKIIASRRGVVRVARYIFEAFQLVRAAKMFIPEGYNLP